MNAPTLTPRELATVLAALRYWQSDFGGNGATDDTRFDEFFHEHTSLDANEIDNLCEKLNQ